MKTHAPGSRSKFSYPVIPLRSACRWAVWLAAAFAFFSGFLQTGYACDICNLNFADEVVNERAESPLGRDMKRAMQNQNGLKLDGYSNPALMKAQMAKLATAEDASTEKADSEKAE